MAGAPEWYFAGFPHVVTVVSVAFCRLSLHTSWKDWLSLKKQHREEKRSAREEDLSLKRGLMKEDGRENRIMKNK